jgi:peptide/nickel transport system substrate-binding protein
VKRHSRFLTTGLMAVVAAAVVAACGSSSSSTPAASSSSTTAATGGTVTLLMGSAPQSLDPQMDYTTQGAEINWIAYTGLTTYAHASGSAGTAVIPGLCTELPVVSDGGLTYTCTLRHGLEFSNGKPVVASDFTYAVERAIKMPWGGSGAFITPVIAGGTAFADGKAKTITGITTNNTSGVITMHLTAPYGPWDNVLAFPAMGLVYPPAAPFKNEPNNPPPGVGPYYVKNIVPNASFTAVPNPKWASFKIPGIPAAHVTVNVKVNQTNTAASAESVLNNTADFFDWADTIPGSLISQIKSKASDRYRLVDLGGSTYYIFMNQTEKPFNNQLAREAVVTALNEQAFVRIGSGTLIPACWFLPPAVPGHPPASAKCPYSNAQFTGDIAKAKQLVQQSGLAGTPVTVWSQGRPPRQQWMTYYTQILNEIGFKATQKVIADASYWTTLGDLKLHPQTGFADWNMDYPNPVDFYLLVTKAGILPQNNENFGEVQDPYIDNQVNTLKPTPTSDLSTVASKWQSLDEYVAKKADVAVFGYQTFPFFASDRINYAALVFQPEYGWDWTSFQLK